MIGLDLLGGAHPKFPWQKICGIIPNGWALGVLDCEDTFGDAFKRIRNALNLQKFSALRVHLHWNPQHIIVPIKKLKKKLPQYEHLAKEFPGTKIYISHSLEYDEPSEAKVGERIRLIRELAPACIPVNSVWRGAVLSDVITERHGGTGLKVKPGEIASTDGENIYDIDAKAWLKHNEKALIRFLWGYRFNLRQITKAGELPPPPKKRTAAPSIEYAKSIIKLAEYTLDKKPIFKNGELWKSHAEDSQGSSPDSRQNKPVLILKNKIPYVLVVAENDKVIDKMPFSGIFNDVKNLYLYRSNRWGFQMAEQAFKFTGKQYVKLIAGDRKIGPFNPTFRYGYYR